ncbi:hypothetical protein [Pararhodobacter aggregans]
MRALALGALLALAGPAGAQTIAPFAGEHADFTRIVLRIPPGTGWALTPEGRERAFTLTAEGARYDLARLFQRIPRLRLAEASAAGPVLNLALACDCPIRAWEERPGLVILDITDAPPEGAPPPSPPAVPRRVPPPDPIAAGRAAGAALARTLPQPAPPEAPAPEADPRLETLAQDLGRSIAAAAGQGLLDVAADHAAPGQGVLPDTPLPDMPPNIRIATVLDRPDPDAPPVAAPPALCNGSELLDRLLGHDPARFTEDLGRLTRALYGEFDQPDPQSQLELIGVYLSAGFGAEARALIDNSPDPVAGRDFALGTADVLEDRASNSRMRLAQAIDCGGAASVMAVLAGADATAIRQNADQLALTFSTLPASMRGLIGLRLAEALVDAGALDAARIVADALQRSDWVSPGALALVEARLDRARGLPGDAALRLAHEGDASSDTVQTRLDLALQTEAPVPPEYIAGAEALAATARDEPTGPELMAAVIRLNARSGAMTDAFAALDRLESWMSGTGENRRLLGDLRDEVWAAMASNGTDLGLVEAVLSREDWRDPALLPQTRRALAARLLDLRLATPVEALVGTLDDPEARVLRARAALDGGDGTAALALLGEDDSEAARLVRAAALERIGQHRAAGDEFATLGDTGAETRAAILDSDWRRVEGLAAAQEAPAPASELGPLLGRPPGHAEIALTRPDDAPPPVDATDPATPASGLPADAVPAEAAPSPPPDPGAVFDRLGLVRRSSTLLAESERLRGALAPLVQAAP